MWHSWAFSSTTDFVASSANDIFNANLPLLHIILPLGISFITFQKIAFLVDVQAGRIRSFTFQDYCTFVLFFPQLIAGPIVHYREMMPQFQAASCRFDKENVAVGLTLLVFGLFKKVVFADKIAHYVTPLYQHSAAGGSTSFLLAWVAAVGFTLQIYFDFSGYTDMALGLARLFGIRLPQKLQLALARIKHHRFLAALAYDADSFSDRVHLQPLVAVPDKASAGKGVAGVRREEHDGRSVHLPAHVSHDYDHAYLRFVARRRLRIYCLGRAAWNLP